MAKVDTHLVSIIPPSPHRISYLVMCSYNDLTMTYLNKVEAFDAAYEHIRTMRLMNSLERGDYQFDDGME